MATRGQIHTIREKNGNVTPRVVHVKKGHGVQWIPDSHDKITIHFTSGSPFDSDDLPGAFPGMSVGAIVTKASGGFPYQVNTIHGITIDSEPQIIVDTGNRKKNRKKKKAGKKKAGKKKSGKKR